MDCRELQEKLTEYVDGFLSDTDRVSVEEHVKGCERCRRDLVEMEAVVRRLRTTEELEPPPWMHQRIMARVREEAEGKKSIVRRLLYPLHIKLPIEAGVAVLLVITAVYIIKVSPPEMQLAQAPREKSVPVLAEREHGTPVDKSRMGGVPSSEGHLKREGTQDRVRTKAAPEPATLRDSARQAATPSFRDGKDPVPTAQLARLKAEDREPLRVVLATADPEAALTAIEQVIRRVDGRLASTERVEEHIIVKAECTADKLSELIRQLATIGSLKGQPPVSEHLQGPVVLAVEITQTPPTR